ncbi:hypothetical protein D3C87_1005550 [compost metagenome]
MKDKILYLIGAVLMPVAFLGCILLAFLDGLSEALKETAYDTRRNWRTLVDYYRSSRIYRGRP